MIEIEKYPKIQSIFKRDMLNNPSKLIEGDFTNNEFKYLANNVWIGTEKIDGTNIRVIWDGQHVTFRGRTDRAILNDRILKMLQEKFDDDNLKETFGETPVILFGEAYGERIQKGHNYIPNGVDFILFDIKIGHWWLDDDGINENADKLGIDVVPIIAAGTIYDLIDIVKHGFKSTIAHNHDYDAEGLVCKPDIPLFDRAGRRIITKIKTRDF